MTTAAEETAGILERLKEKKKEIAAKNERLKKREAAIRLENWKKEAARKPEEVAAMIEKLEKMPEKEVAKLALDLCSYEGRVNGVRKLTKFEVDEICVLESKTIYTLILVDESRSYCTTIESKILKQVVDFCQKRASVKCNVMRLGGGRDNHDLKAFDSAYLDKLSSTSWGVLIKILRAACELRIISLMDLTSTAIVNMVYKKDTSEILKMFNLRYSISLKEMGQATMKLHSRVFRGDVGPSNRP